MAKSITEIKKEFETLTLVDQQALVVVYQTDMRKGVQTFLNQVEKRYKKHLIELERMKMMTEFEEHLISKGITNIVGIDEVGRGPLAGPVVACAVRLNDYTLYDGINDSKKVSLANRERLFEVIQETAADVAFGMATHEEIDEINILNATKLAMKRAIENLKEKPEHILIDAVKLDDIHVEQTSIIKGDEKSMTIAAASIMAKVTRDQMMKDLAETYPEYDFANNKGYGTASHYKGLNEVGISPIHRRTFVKDFI